MTVRPKERMWYTADRSKLVPAGHPDAASQGPKEFSDDEAKRLGLKPDTSKAMAPAGNKAVAGPAQKKNAG